MPPGILIRRITADDAEALWRLRLTALESDPIAFGESADEHRQTTPIAHAARLRDSGGFVLGAFDGADLVGMAGLHREKGEKRRHKARLWGVFVLPSHRGRGIARALVSGILDGARELPSLRQVQLSVSVKQRAARSLYASLGFRSFGVEPEALQSGGEYFAEEHMHFPLKA